jgi:hypothetical protein
MKLEAAPGVKEAQMLGARLGTSALQIPLQNVNVPPRY